MTNHMLTQTPAIQTPATQTPLTQTPATQTPNDETPNDESPNAGRLAGEGRGGSRAALVAAGEGAHHHFLDHLATVVVGSDTLDSGVSAVVFDSPQGFGPPLHVHHDDDEIIYLIDGRMRVSVDGLDEVVDAGAVAVLPRGVPHAFQVLSDTARFLSVTSSPTGPAGFDRFVADLGTPIPSTDLPPAEGIDPGRVAQVGSRHGIEVLGPPLGVS